MHRILDHIRPRYPLLLFVRGKWWSRRWPESLALYWIATLIDNLKRSQIWKKKETISHSIPEIALVTGPDRTSALSFACQLTFSISLRLPNLPALFKGAAYSVDVELMLDSQSSLSNCVKSLPVDDVNGEGASAGRFDVVLAALTADSYNQYSADCSSFIVDNLKKKIVKESPVTMKMHTFVTFFSEKSRAFCDVVSCWCSGFISAFRLDPGALAASMHFSTEISSFLISY